LLISAVVQSFHGLPVYWIGDGRTPPPHIPGVAVTRIGSYELTTLTPTLDRDARPGTSNSWNFTAVVYALQPASDTIGK
jgi:hypothetical protein